MMDEAYTKETRLSRPHFSSFIFLQERRSLYINSHVGHTPKGEEHRNYLVCYLTWEKKETSGKEIE